MPAHLRTARRALFASLLCLVSSAAAACGGSGGFQQAALRAPASPPPPLQIDDGEIGHALGLRSQLPKPYRLGVYFREAPQHADGEARVWRWEPEHRARMMELLQPLEQGEEVAAVFTISRATVVGDDLRAIRLAAARHGADGVLVVSGHDELEREANLWALSYVAVVPILFAPAQELGARFFAHAELWDVRNEYLYVAAEAEADAEQTRPLPFLDRREATAEAQDEAMALLAQELQKRLRRVHGG